METNGYSLVRLNDLVPSKMLQSSEGQRVAELAAKGAVYKKDNKLYVLVAPNYGERGRNDETLYLNSYDIKPIFSYNAGYQPLTEENWKARAEQVLETDVKEYDNYLTDEVYGFQCIECLEEVDSCWGFNPGSGDIKDLMNDELRGWFGADMDFEYESDEEFDIEEYFEENDFPELRGEIRKLVESQLHHTTQKAERNHEAFPYAVSYEDICWNKNGVLEDVIESLYEEHKLPSEAHIDSVFRDIAGISREYMPKLTAADLEPGRDYTVDELMELVQSKTQGQVDKLLADANNRVESSKSFGKETEKVIGNSGLPI